MSHEGFTAFEFGFLPIATAIRQDFLDTLTRNFRRVMFIIIYWIFSLIADKCS